MTLLAAASAAEEPAPAPSPVVTVESVEVTPTVPDAGPPRADTLVALRVRVANHGEVPVTSLHFVVRVGGVALPIYDKQSFLVTVPAGGDREIELYNFWTTETGRPAPADGKLAVEVTLDEAYPLEVSSEEDGTEVWSLGEPLEGLGSSHRIVVELSGISAR